jgi:hypothetical protein
VKGPYIRACRKHGKEVEDRTALGSRKEILWCPDGHRVRSWDVKDSNGEVVSVAFMNEAPHHVAAELSSIATKLILRPPEQFCGKGHFEWMLEGLGYRCRICRRESLLRKMERAKERKLNERSSNR